MTNSLNYLFESGVSLGLLTLFFVLVLKQEKSFVFNRFYLLGSVLLSIALPFVHFAVGKDSYTYTAGTVFLENIDINQQFTDTSPSLLAFLPPAYGLIALFFLVRIAINMYSVRRNKGEATHFSGHSEVVLTNSEEAFSLFNTIYLGDKLSDSERQVILSHELVHVKEKHSIDLLMIEVVTALLWINPFLYIIKNLIRTNHEYLADAHALRHHNKDTYIGMLATHTLEKYGFSLAHTFHTSATLNRIRMINKQKHKIMRIKQVIPFVLAIALLVVFGCDEGSQSPGEISDIQSLAATSGNTEQDKIYDDVEELPTPIDGKADFYAWIGQNLKYPEEARKKGIEGQVFVEFILDKAGNITNVKAIRGIGGGCDDAAVELIKCAAPWNPGKIDGKAVSVRMILPINFKIG